jgi:hypothetical protein
LPQQTDKKSVTQMIGEVLRDIGILIVVFFPLDEWITWKTLTPVFVSVSVLLSAFAVIAGIVIERKRR